MPKARIYQPRKNAMQSGRAKTDHWVVEFEPAPQRLEPLMGWSGFGDTRNQVRLTFDSKEEALAYARRTGLDYQLFEPRPRHVRPKAYADNFRTDRKFNWTH